MAAHAVARRGAPRTDNARDYNNRYMYICTQYDVDYMATGGYARPRNYGIIKVNAKVQIEEPTEEINYDMLVRTDT